MAMIYVRVKEGRKAFFQGKVLPQDKFVPVPNNPYIRRLVHVWEDLEVQGEEGKPSSASAKQPMTRVPGANPTVTPSTPPAPGTGSPAPKA